MLRVRTTPPNRHHQHPGVTTTMIARLTRKAVAASALAAMAAMAPTAHADVLNFDNLPAGVSFFTANYQGFQLGTNSIATTAWFHSDEETAFYNPSSGTKFVATDFQLYTGALFEDAQPISSTVDFVFSGAFFSGGDKVRYKLYNDGNLVFTSADSPTLTGTPIFVPSGYVGLVDSVVIVGKQGFYAMDDFTYAPVPEPGTYGLMAAGLLGLGAYMRRRSQG